MSAAPPRPMRAAGLPAPLDHAVVARCRKQDPVAFRAFVVRHAAMVFALLSRRLGRGPEVQDLAQEFLALTGESKAFESELAQSLGPEEAHRVVYSDGLCMGMSVFGGERPLE